MDNTVNKKRDNKKILLILFIILIIFISFMLINKFIFNNKITIEDVEEIQKKQENVLIYIYNSNKEECNNCNSIKEYLNSKKINYKLYDINNLSNDEYKKFLKQLHVDINTIKLPAFLYLKDGKIYSYLIGINNNKILEKFILNYDLNKL